MNSTRAHQPFVDDVGPRYARMILGNAAAPLPRLPLSTTRQGAEPFLHSKKTCPSRNEQSRARTLAQLFIPQPFTDPLTLYRLVVADWMVLAAMCSTLLLVSPEWAVPVSHLPAFAVLLTLYGFSEGIYKAQFEPPSTRIVPPLARATIFAAVLTYITAHDEMRVRAALTTSLTCFTGLLLWRLLKHSFQQRVQRDREARNVLIVGGGPIGRAIARSLAQDSAEQVVVRGFLDDDLPLSPRVLGRIADLELLARAEFIDEVILALPDQPQRTREVAEIALCNRLDIRAVPDLPTAFWSDAATERIGDVPVVTLHREPQPSARLLLKRLLDVVLAAIALVLLGPLMALVALLIRLDSPGPIFYGAERVGAKGRRFRCFKFRSMVADADHLKPNLLLRNQRQGPIFKIDDDPRVTRVGRVLRRYSLDELPQLWNVLRGEMSLVGPRPHPVDDVNRYELHHYRRLDVKPGITGLWQITARNCPSFDLNMHLDLAYIENWSLLLDVRILARTVHVLFAPEGA